MLGREDIGDQRRLRNRVNLIEMPGRGRLLHEGRYALVERTFEIIKDIRARGVTVVLVEQNAFAALELSDRSYVLEQGRVALSGTGAELLDNPHVQSAYLGA